MNFKSIFTLLISAALSSSAMMAQGYSLPKLEYSYEALEPYIDAQTMEIHYTKHHQGYVNNINKAAAGTKMEGMAIEDLLINAERRGSAVRNNGGGHYNHTLFWSILSPTADKTPNGKLADEINKTFASLDSLKKLLNSGAATRFGSGWVWLYVTPEKKLAVCSTPNQDNPLMDANGANRGIPILGIDVWEHAYYLKYQNKRNDYLGAIWNVLDWESVSNKYDVALKSPLLKVIEKDAWAALKEFHSVMSQTFHPMEEGNYQPIRGRAAEMSVKAVNLSNTKIPASFDSADVKMAIAELVTGSAALEKLVSKKAKDEKIKDSLIKLHDTFHKIQGLCADH